MFHRSKSTCAPHVLFRAVAAAARRFERALVTCMKLEVHLGTCRDARARIARLLRVPAPVDNT